MRVARIKVTQKHGGPVVRIATPDKFFIYSKDNSEEYAVAWGRPMNFVGILAMPIEEAISELNNALLYDREELERRAARNGKEYWAKQKRDNGQRR